MEELQFLKGLTEADLKKLQADNPRGFAELGQKVKEYRIQLARTDINHFIQYIMFDEATRRPLRQAPYHIELQNFLESNKFSVVVSHPSAGKCLTESSVVVTNDGVPITVRELKRRVDAGEDVRIATLDVIGHNPRWVRVKSVFFDGVVPCTRVRTSDGRETVVSNNHPFRALCGKTDPRHTWLRADQLIRGSTVVTTDTMPRPTAGHAPRLSAEDAFVLGFLMRFADRQSTRLPKGETVDLKARGLQLGFRHGNHDLSLDYDIARVARTICARYGWSYREQTRVSPARTWTQFRIEGALEWLEALGVDYYAERYGMEGTWRMGFRRPASWAGPIPPAVYASTEAAEAFAVGYLLQAPISRSDNNRAALGVPPTMAQALIYLFNRIGIAASVRHDRQSTTKPKGPVTRMLLHGIGTLWLYQCVRSVGGPAFDQVVRDLKVWYGLGDHQVVARPRVVQPQAWKHAKVIEVEPAGDHAVYGIEIDDPQHTHLTDGILTHNTQQVSVARPLFELGRNPNLRIAIVQSTGQNARDIIQTIAAHIESNTRLHEVFPNLRRGGMWTQNSLTVVREYGVKDPSIQARGAFAKILGARIDLLLADDLLSPDYTRTLYMRQRIREWFLSELMTRLTADARAMWMANAWHPDDLSHELMRTPGWAGMFMPVRDPVTKESYWPEVWTQERIAEWEAMRTPSEAARVLDCIARSDDASRFREEWFKRALNRGTGVYGEQFTMLPELELVPRDDNGVPLVTGRVFSGVDLAFSDKKRSDWNVIFTIMVTDDGKVYLLNIERGRWPTAETVDRIVSTHQRYGATIFVESVSAQKAVIDWCNDIHAEVPVYPFGVRGQGETHNKWHAVYGVESVAVGLKNDLWVIPRAGTRDDPGDIDPLIREWINECMSFTGDPNEHTGDALTASWIAVQGARMFGGEHHMSSIEISPGYGDQTWDATVRKMQYEEARARAGEAVFATISLDEPESEFGDEPVTFQL